MNKNPQRILRFRVLGLEVRKVKIDEIYYQANANMRNMAALYPHVTNLNFEVDGFFNELPFAEEVLIYMDRHHLNEKGSKRYSIYAHKKFSAILSNFIHINPNSFRNKAV